ncbi:MAG TPA: bifunctional UDP-N-acetylglucosamine diphosphorylase/glucosamine-1-phosphate N-acetyltransferase GlmU [Massilibacterium sp.]|nr:bifunctional UDP-N-acetylglucosamine diphosphorylase/glucosamine-1-phosphate N-acetyltransferase GlmU [Massilibacterium sp.]
MNKRFAVILAAGQGTRMKSKLYKVLHQVCGKPMVEHVVDQVSGLGCEKIVAIVGFGAEKVKERLGDRVEYAYQEEQLGTGHAVLMAEENLAQYDGETLVVCGDTPLITTETMEALLKTHQQRGAKATILTAQMENPTGYGRIIRNKEGFVERIVEEKDATDAEKEVTEINTGTYCFDNRFLFEALQKVGNDNAQGEYYLPDVIEILKNEGETIAAHVTASFEETIGVNDRVALSVAEEIMRKRINEKHMRQGVTIIDPNNTYISADTEIGRDTIIYPNTTLSGRVVIGEDCLIGPNTEIENATIGQETVIKQSVVEDSFVGNRVKIGPFAHLRPASEILDDVKIGNFVEVKKSVLKKGAKASHLSYIGDAEIGENVNLGCGSITVNYDGVHKFKTIVEDDAFIGCNSNLIAPVLIEKGAYIAAGSTITNDVPHGALSIARARQVNKEGYAEKLNQKKNS